MRQGGHSAMPNLRETVAGAVVLLLSGLLQGFFQPSQDHAQEPGGSTRQLQVLRHSAAGQGVLQVPSQGRCVY